MSNSLRRGIIAASMPPWSPGQLVRDPTEGSWWNGYNMKRMWTDVAGTTLVTSDSDIVKRWSDSHGSRIFTQSVVGDAPVWDAATKSVRFDDKVGNPKNFIHHLGFSIPTTQDVTILATVATTGITGRSRSVFGLAHNPFLAGASYFVLNPRTAPALPPTNTGGSVSAQLYPYTVSNTYSLSYTYSTGNMMAISATRSNAAGNKIVDLYLDGSIVAAGPTFEAADDTLDSIYIFGPQTDYSPGVTMYLKDFVVVFRKLKASEHIAYAAYSANLP